MNKMTVLLICDDYWHPADVILRGLRTLQTEDIEFDVVTDAKDCLTPEYLTRYPAIVNCKCNNINAANTHPWFEKGVTEVGPAEFAEYIQNGGGFVSIHSGNAFFKENDCAEYINLVGNYFVKHPPRCDVTAYPVGAHPVTEGLALFTIRDEHYEIAVTAEDAEVFLKTESQPGGTQIGGYTRTLGAGRICVLTPGHNVSVWEHPGFRKLLLQSIRWSVGRI